MIRYADDFVACFAKEKDAVEFAEELKIRLAKYGLSIAEEKSRIIKFGKWSWLKAQNKKEKLKTFDFLGFTHYCGKNRGGKFLLVQRTSRKKFRQKLIDIRQWLRQETRKPVKMRKTIITKINQKLTGHYQYYGIRGNYRMLKTFHMMVRTIFFRALNSRSQRKSCTWEVFNKMLKYNPLRLPKIREDS